MRVWIEAEYGNGCMFRVYRDYEFYLDEEWRPPLGEWNGDEVQSSSCPGYYYLEMMGQDDRWGGMSYAMHEGTEIRLKAWEDGSDGGRVQ